MIGAHKTLGFRESMDEMPSIKRYIQALSTILVQGTERC
jgi:hypothetical protein